MLSSQLDSKTVQIMIFIFRAIEEGWTVSKLENDKYEFRKALQNIRQEVTSEDFVPNFLKNFSSVDSFFSLIRMKASPHHKIESYSKSHE